MMKLNSLQGTDHLGGTNIITDSTGAITQTLDYYPYGETRIDTGTNDETKQFTGYIKDSSTGLNYAGQRYYTGNIGRFISQDPVALALGNQEKMKEISKIELKKYLGDPQSHNTYTYTRNNPVKYIDENGEWFKEYFSGQQSFNEFHMEIGQAAAQLSDDNYAWDFAITNPEVTGPIVGASSGIVASGIVEGIATYETAIALSRIPETSISQIVGKAGYGLLSTYIALQVPDLTSDFLTNLGKVQNGITGAEKDTLISGVLLFGPQSLGQNSRAAWDIGSTTFESLNSLFEKREVKKEKVEQSSIQKSNRNKNSKK